VITLDRHLENWLGRWPAAGRGLDVVGSARRDEPGWDGRRYPAVGISTPDSGVLSVPPGRVDAVRALADRPVDELLAHLPEALDRPGGTAYRGVFRWTTRPEPLSDAGIWLPFDRPVVPEWLRPFGGDVLVALDEDTGAYLAGVGIKRHDRYGHELAVGTVEAARGRGLARRLVCQAARRVLDGGAVPTYVHDPANVASAKVARAAGFADLGWSAIGVG
jgi:RimJ/RimL family protein N-acetyltransferase